MPAAAADHERWWWHRVTFTNLVAAECRQAGSPGADVNTPRRPPPQPLVRRDYD
jgi:hypothetical protein